MYFIERESFIIILNYWLVSLLLYLQTIWNTIILSILWKRRVRPLQIDRQSQSKIVVSGKFSNA